MKKSLIYLDEEDIQSSIDLLEAVRQIYRDECYETYAFCFNQPIEAAECKFNYVFSVRDNMLQGCDIVNLTNCLEELHRTYLFDSILIPASYQGRMLAPRLAMRLGVGLVADVTRIEYNDGELEMVRPAFSGKLFAGVTNKNCSPVMMSVRPNVFTYTSKHLKDTKIIPFHPVSLQPSKIKLLEAKEKERAKDIRESEILVSGGGGAAHHFDWLYQLADELNGMVSASRRVVDSGIAGRSIQVGQSGKTVSPRLYIALGIYGSLQHMEGLKNVESIISVNINRNAPICSLSDIVVEGDSKEFIEKLLTKIRNSKKNKDMEAER
ncbi:electron transfer flavoprotein alpha subunit [Anaerobacterium chartisolvens]|uniref:Electron transfer flavoprotein alpha subunit n=1 Tax=Anaerobacterium chartisolvens TaxID=1297424 RepID=A0A369B8R0_9FIRM|nr:electron transfer flavoprotein subunit alpha/FixB family protein [Anaerobacterium chartisolvens]RCX17919.1 electron transfer flavoprotein alpha subunit [Anaerobacterium chartisolvens]